MKRLNYNYSIEQNARHNHESARERFRFWRTKPSLLVYNCHELRSGMGRKRARHHDRVHFFHLICMLLTKMFRPAVPNRQMLFH